MKPTMLFKPFITLKMTVFCCWAFFEESAGVYPKLNYSCEGRDDKKY